MNEPNAISGKRSAFSRRISTPVTLFLLLVTMLLLSPTMQVSAADINTATATVNEDGSVETKKPEPTPPVWKSSGSYRSTGKGLVNDWLVMDMPLTAGTGVDHIYKWVIQVDDPCRGMELGVVAATSPLIIDDKASMETKSRLSNLELGWAVNQDAEVWHDSKPRKAVGKVSTFGKRSQITFVLDLSDGKGTLRASVDDQNSVRLFTNMLQKNANGFVPAVSFAGGDSNRGSIKFLGFQECTNAAVCAKSVPTPVVNE
jgi:hypothetical protein